MNYAADVHSNRLVARRSYRQNLNRTINCSCLAKPVPTLSVKKVSLLWLWPLIELICPKVPLPAVAHVNGAVELQLKSRVKFVGSAN